MSSLTLVPTCATQNEDKARGTLGDISVGANYAHGAGTSDSKAIEPVLKLGVDEGKNSNSNTDSGARNTSPISEMSETQEGIKQLNLRLCMRTWLDPNLNFLHQMTSCIAALSEIG